MDIFKQYDTFKEKCAEFPDKLEERCFRGCSLICHPTAENVLISMCSDEEAHSNAICICRMADMLLMSDDAEEWTSFNLQEARKVAEQNGYIYLTDLFGEDAFLSEDWMINGKNDTVIVSEAYMREKGKRYAPVTPLTNKVLHFKKYNGVFFWKPSEPGKIIRVDKDYIDGCFEEFFSECSQSYPDLSESETIKFPLFDREITIDVNTTRIRTIEGFFAETDRIAAALADTDEILGICGYEFSAIDFLLRLMTGALRNNGIDMTEKRFAEEYYSPVLNGDDKAARLAELGQNRAGDDIDCLKIAFIDAVRAEYAGKIEYSAGDFSFYEENIRRLELGSFEPEEEKYLISELLSHRPEDYRIFYFINKKYPEEAENAAAAADFWQIAPLSDEDMENTVLGAYLPDENFDEQGRFCAGYEESRILKEQIEKVMIRYGFTNREVVDELEQRLEVLDRERRTFNGTLFDTPEEMKLAVKNEAYIQDLCTDLSALNESELNALEEHIDNTTLDDNTKSKYKLKVKLARNNIQSSVLEQRCLKLPIMSLDEITDLRKKLADEDYPEAVVKPFAARIREAFTSAQTNEIEVMLKGSEDMDGDALDGVAAKLDSGRYDKSIADYYKEKIADIKEKNLRAKLDSMTAGFENFGKEKLSGLIKTLSESKDFPKRLTMPLVHKITDTLNNYEINEAAKTFEGVDFADEEQLARMKKAVADGLYSDEIAAPYILRIEQREKDLRDEKLNDMCRDIDSMDQEQLDALREQITDPEADFDQELVTKYLDRMTQRGCELRGSELAELCKYIFSMEQHELDELKEKLADEKYDKEYTDVYYKKIAEREQELLVVELDRLCAGIDDADMEVLEKLKARIIDEERYADVCDEYIAAINNRIDNIRTAEYRQLIGSVAEMTEEEVDNFRREAEDKRYEIGEELYEQSIAAADDRENVLENQAIEDICGDIGSYGFEQAEDVRNRLQSEGFPEEKIAPYLERIDDRITELYTAELDEMVEGIGSMNKEQLIQVQIRIGESGCPDHLKEEYSGLVGSAIAGIADREMRAMCGNIGELSAKKSEDLIRKINNMPLDEQAKSRYIDMLDSHIASLKENEAREYIRRLTIDMQDNGVNSVHLSVPGMSNLFSAKYDKACATYVSVGRYELPILVHDVNAEIAESDGFTMTTEYLHIRNRGILNRIKVDDIASFQAKKTLMSSGLTVVEKNGSSSELPNSLKKDVIENVAKVLTSLVSFIHDRRSAEHMKELLENAVQEKAAQTAAMTASVRAAEPAPESEPVPELNNEMGFETIAVPDVDSLDMAADEAQSAPPIMMDSEDEQPMAASVPEPESIPAPAAPEVKAKFCDQCGARITSPTAKFCAECGNKLM